ncbi:MAG TPA: ABC transporter permease, partial [Gemmatimonadales bacterium]
VEDELRFHLDMREQHYRSRGLNPTEAREAARRKFGDLARHRRTLRRQDGRRLRRAVWSDRLGAWVQDFRFAARMLWHHRGFSLAVIATLALGIGATTAIFSAVDAAILRPLPFAHPEELVELVDVTIPFAPDGQTAQVSELPDIREVDRMREQVSSVAAYAVGGLNLSGFGAPIRVQVGVVTTGFFSTLGVAPARGRSFVEAEGRPGEAAVTIISHGLWIRQFGGDSAIGRDVRLNGRSYRVVGIMPPRFTFPEGADLWIPLTVPMTFETFTPFRGGIFQTVVARMAPGGSRTALEARLRARWRRLPAEYRDNYAAVVAEPVKSLQLSLAGSRTRPMLVLLGATGLLLLIACANVTNLLLAHAATRERELAVRAVLGATHGRLMRQMLVQSVVLAIAGALAGLVLAVVSLRLMTALMPAAMIDVAAPRLDPRLLGFALGLSVLTGLCVGLWPALSAGRRDAQTAMKSGGGYGATGAGRGRLRRLLVTAELALALMLLAGAGLMLRSFRTLVETDPGFVTDRVAALQVVLEQATRPSRADRLAIVHGVIDRLLATPGIESAGLINDLPLSGQSRISVRVDLDGPGGEARSARYVMATQGYFSTLGIPLLSGRLMAATDDSAAPKVAVINQTMAKTFWPGENPLGKRITWGQRGDSRTIIGVVGDVRERLDLNSQPMTYFPIEESPPSNIAVVARGRLDKPALLAALREAARAVDPGQAVYNVRTLNDMRDISLAPRRSNTQLITVFGLLALVLAVVGVYGVVAYGVTLRSRELGIRAALGARRADLARLVVGEGLAVGVIGTGLGLAGALALSRVLRGLLYGVEPTDAAALLAATAALLLPTIGATLLPARRAARANPVEVMRAE